jgi:hypothetical protein
VSIPAVAPPIDPGTPTSLPPGSKASRLTGAIDDTAGTGIVIPLNMVDGAYVDWRMQTLDGWDSADLEENAETRVGADGSWDADNYYAGRIVTVGGLLTAPTYEAREVAEYQLRQAVPPRRLVQLRIDEVIPKYVMGRRSGRLRISPVTDVISQWSVTLLAPDPRKYALDALSVDLSAAQAAAGLAPPWTPPVLLPDRPPGSDTATLVNTGTYESPPLIRIAGPGTNPSVANLTTGLVLAYDVVLGVTDYLLIDVAAGVALLNGVAPRAPVSGSSVTSRFFIARNENRLKFRATATDPVLVATATIQVNPAWD